MKYVSNNKFYCFSPPVMIATFLIEIGLAIYTLWRYGLNSITRVTTVIFICLAFFQLAEFNVCEGSWGIDSASWARLGYVAITLLPPLGIHLIAKLSGEKRRWPYYGAYALSAMFISYFIFATNGVSAEACLGNYVIFEQGEGTGFLYGLYYYGLLLVAIAYAMWLSGKDKIEPQIKKSLHALVIGYVLFMVPTTFVNIVNPATIAGIPSIMCGFAVLLAITIAFAVLPFAHQNLEKRKPNKNKLQKRK